jgi:hypothetical protein
MLLTATVLFIILSPGLLLTLPPVGKKVWMSGKMSVISVFVHAVVFFALMAYRKSIPLLNQLEGFQTAASTCTDECGTCPTGQQCIDTGTPSKKEFKCGVLCGGSKFGLCPATIGRVGTTSPQTCELDKTTNTFKCMGANCDSASPNGYCPYGGTCTPAIDNQGKPTNICKLNCDSASPNGYCPNGGTCKTSTACTP